LTKSHFNIKKKNPCQDFISVVVITFAVPHIILIFMTAKLTSTSTYFVSLC